MKLPRCSLHESAQHPSRAVTVQLAPAAHRAYDAFLVDFRVDHVYPSHVRVRKVFRDASLDSDVRDALMQATWQPRPTPFQPMQEAFLIRNALFDWYMCGKKSGSEVPAEIRHSLITGWKEADAASATADRAGGAAASRE